MSLLLRWLVLPVFLLTVGFACGWRIDEWRHGAAETKGVQRIVRVVHAQGAINEAVATKQQAEHDRVVYVTRTLTKEIPIYVPAEADHHCVINNGFRVLHDAAAAGVLAIPLGSDEPADADSGVSLSAVADTIVNNYSIANECRAQVANWVDWYNAQKSAFNHK